MRIARALMGMCALGLGACAAAPNEPTSASPPSAPAAASVAPASLVGTRWIGSAEKSADPRTLPRLEFVTEGRVSGFTGCNLLSGTWRMEGGEVKLGTLVTTKRMCLGPEGETEKRMLAALGENGRVTREGSKLVLTGAGGARFELVEASAG